VLLADHLVEGLRAVAAIQGGLGHEGASLVMGAARPGDSNIR
jgi:hypothetical protein